MYQDVPYPNSPADLEIFAKKLLVQDRLIEFIRLREGLETARLANVFTPLVPECAKLLLKSADGPSSLRNFVLLREAVIGHKAQEDALTPFMQECGKKMLDTYMLDDFRNLKACVRNHEKQKACLESLDDYTFMILPRNILGSDDDVCVSLPHDQRLDGSGPKLPRIVCYAHEGITIGTSSALDLVHQWRRAGNHQPIRAFQNVIKSIADQHGPARNAALDFCVVLGLNKHA